MWGPQSARPPPSRNATCGTGARTPDERLHVEQRRARRRRRGGSRRSPGPSAGSGAGRTIGGGGLGELVGLGHGQAERLLARDVLARAQRERRATWCAGGVATKATSATSSSPELLAGRTCARREVGRRRLATPRRVHDGDGSMPCVARRAVVIAPSRERPVADDRDPDAGRSRRGRAEGARQELGQLRRAQRGVGVAGAARNDAARAAPASPPREIAGATLTSTITLPADPGTSGTSRRPRTRGSRDPRCGGASVTRALAGQWLRPGDRPAGRPRTRRARRARRPPRRARRRAPPPRASRRGPRAAGPAGGRRRRPRPTPPRRAPAPRGRRSAARRDRG